MEKYKNLSGDSPINAYEIGPDFIKVEFLDGTTYLYTYESTGRDNVEHMKELAKAGGALSSFINNVVKEAYAEKMG